MATLPPHRPSGVLTLPWMTCPLPLNRWTLSLATMRSSPPFTPLPWMTCPLPLNRWTLSRYDEIFSTIHPLCPACESPLSRTDFTCTMHHLLYNCTAPSIRGQRKEMVTNLGLRLMAQGAVKWWESEPRASGSRIRDLDPPSPPWSNHLWSQLTASHRVNAPTITWARPNQLPLSAATDYYVHASLSHAPLSHPI